MSIAQVPDEVIQHLLYFVSPTDNLANVQSLCYRFNQLANEQLLWRHHCQASFRYWSPEHDFAGKLSLTASEVDWKSLFILRQRRNARAARLLDEVRTTKLRRVRNMEQLCLLGYDIKDLLLEQLETSEFAEDVLSRRYFCEAVLNSIHRAVAIKEWHRLGPRGNDASHSQTARGVQLERGLAGFDMFVLYDQPGGIDDITQMIDESTLAFRSSQPDLEEFTPRQKALALNRWLREKKRFGGLDGLNYRVLRNCMISHIMRQDEAGCLPVIASAIFCSMADRLGLEAHCCPVPGHVHVVVLAKPGHRLDGRAVEDADKKREEMYLDPYGSDDEVTVSNIEQHLANLVQELSLDQGLTPAPPASVALRTAQNIKASFQRTTALPHEAWSFMVQLSRGHPVVNINAAYYSSMWASLLLAPAYSADWDLELSLLMKRFAASWPEDAWLIEKYLIPLWNSFMPSRGPWARRVLPETSEFWKPLSLLREQDETVPPVIRRDLNGADSGLYRIGQVFRHKRHNRIGIIRGWSHRGSSRFPSLHSTDDMEHSDENSGTEALSPARLRTRVYFVCLVQYALDPYVIAADNMEIIHDANLVEEDMFPWAGKFFKRFDQASCTFVSNMREEYPDD